MADIAARRQATAINDWVPANRNAATKAVCSRSSDRRCRNTRARMVHHSYHRAARVHQRRDRQHALVSHSTPHHARQYATGIARVLNPQEPDIRRLA
jgi:hypothetical protein